MFMCLNNVYKTYLRKFEYNPILFILNKNKYIFSSHTYLNCICYLAHVSDPLFSCVFIVYIQQCEYTNIYLFVGTSR